MIIKSEDNFNKANSLVKMAKITLERLNLIDNEKYPTNAIFDSKKMSLYSAVCCDSFSGVKIP